MRWVAHRVSRRFPSRRRWLHERSEKPWPRWRKLSRMHSWALEPASSGRIRKPEQEPRRGPSVFALRCRILRARSNSQGYDHDYPSRVDPRVGAASPLALLWRGSRLMLRRPVALLGSITVLLALAG